MLWRISCCLRVCIPWLHLGRLGVHGIMRAWLHFFQAVQVDSVWGHDTAVVLSGNHLVTPCNPSVTGLLSTHWKASLCNWCAVKYRTLWINYDKPVNMPFIVYYFALGAWSQHTLGRASCWLNCTCRAIIHIAYLLGTLVSMYYCSYDPQWNTWLC